MALPDIEGLVVVLENRDPHVFSRKPHYLRRISHAYSMASFLEIIAEREITQHFEKRAVALGLSHALQITGSEALLHVAALV
jgi:hypothetical protein